MKARKDAGLIKSLSGQGVRNNSKKTTRIQSVQKPFNLVFYAYNSR